MNTYDPGDSVKVPFTVQDGAGAAADPITLKMHYKAPGGSWVTKTYGTDAEVVKSATGSYYIIIYVPNEAASSGTWYYEGEALGVSSIPLTVSQGLFRVRRSNRLN